MVPVEQSLDMIDPSSSCDVSLWTTTILRFFQELLSPLDETAIPKYSHQSSFPPDPQRWCRISCWSSLPDRLATWRCRQRVQREMHLTSETARHHMKGQDPGDPLEGKQHIPSTISLFSPARERERHARHKQSLASQRSAESDVAVSISTLIWCSVTKDRYVDLQRCHPRSSRRNIHTCRARRDQENPASGPFWTFGRRY